MYEHDLEIEYREIEKLIGYSRNARKHSNKQIKQLAASLREFGFVNPILIDGESGVIAGHGRLLAARQLGMERVPVIELAHLTPDQRRAYVIADNKLALNAGWDEELLRLEVGELAENSFDLGLLGFSDIELGSLLPQPEALGGSDMEPSAELTRKWTPRPGAIWQAGKHRLMCGDSLCEADVFRLIGRTLELVVTDPPYELGAEQVREAMRLMAPRATVLTAQGQAFGLAGGGWEFCFDQVWVRSPKGLMTPWAPQFRHTNVVNLVRSGQKLGWRKAHKSHGSVIEVDGPDHIRGGAYGKNPGVFVEMLRGYGKWTRCGDPFVGTGCSVLACEHLGKSCFGMEREPAQIAVALERLFAAGLTPTRLTTPVDERNGI